MAKLTVKALESLAPRQKPYEVRDDAEPGLWVCVLPSGLRSFVWRYRFHNKTKKLTLGPVGLAEARRMARDARNLRDDGTDPALAKRAQRIAKAEQARQLEREIKKPPDRDDVETVIAAFIERHCEPKLRTGQAVARVLRKDVAGPWKGRRLSEITRADVHELLDGLIDRGAPVQANRLLSYLNKLCRWAVSRGIVAHNPCDGIGKPSEEKSRDRVLDDHELRLVWCAAGELGWPFAPIIRLLILTGQRKSEVAEATWNEFDLDARAWRIPPERVKNKRPHTVPLSPQAVALLKNLPRIQSASDLVFTTTGKTSVSGFSRAKRNIDVAVKALNAGTQIPAWTIHDLRRSAASGMAKNGAELHVIERVLNHVSGAFAGVVGVYQRHTFADEMRAALDAWGRHIEEITSEKAAGDAELDTVEA